MSLNLTKNKELEIKIGTCREPPVAVSGIVQVSSLKLLDAVSHENVNPIGQVILEKDLKMWKDNI